MPMGVIPPTPPKKKKNERGGELPVLDVIFNINKGKNFYLNCCIFKILF